MKWRRPKKHKPTVYVIAGPNQTTFAGKFLPDFVQCREFLNADLIAAGLGRAAKCGCNARFASELSRSGATRLAPRAVA
jgi:hypothetical protein